MRELDFLWQSRSIAIVVAYFVCSVPAATFIASVLKHRDKSNKIISKKNRDRNEDAGGLYIGILERICILTLSLLGQYTAISFVIAAKSLARFKQLSEEAFAERYLIGTLLSVNIALLLGIFVNILFP